MAFFTNPFRSDHGGVSEPASTPGGLPRQPEDALPDEAREKLDALRERRDAAAAAIAPLRETRDEAMTRRQTAEAHLRMLEATYDERRNPEPPAHIAHQRQIVARLVGETKRAAVTYDRAATAWRAAAAIVGPIETYVRQLGGQRVEIAPALPGPILKKGESFADVVAATRAKIERLREDLQAIEDAPWPSGHAKARARAEIERLAESGKPSVMALVESARGSIQWPRTVARPNEPETVDSLALFVWLHKDQLLARLEAEVDEGSDDASALTNEQRIKKTGQARAAILQEERIECSLIEQAEQAGFICARRASCDPRATLGIIGPEPRDQ